MPTGAEKLRKTTEKKKCLKQNGNGREKKVVGDIRKKMYRTEKEKD